MSRVQTLGIIQARMSSTRLPGKVLKPVLGHPLLHYLLERVGPARRINRWVVATSTDGSDEPIAAWCAQHGVACFRGSLRDVLDRYYRCAVEWQPDAVVRLTADCPLHHYAVVDEVVQSFWASNLDYATNSFPPMYEDGFDTEVMRFAALEWAWRTTSQPSEREHVTTAIRSRRTFNLLFRKVNSGYDYKLSVDTSTDFMIVTRIIEALAPGNPFFTMDDVVTLIRQHPEWDIVRQGSPVVTER